MCRPEVVSLEVMYLEIALVRGCMVRSWMTLALFCAERSTLDARSCYLSYKSRKVMVLALELQDDSVDLLWELKYCCVIDEKLLTNNDV